MADPAFDDDDDKPLDPAVERVQARLRRLILVSGLTLGLGLFAVLAAILYRIVADGASGPAAGGVATLTTVGMGLADDARLIATAIDGNRLLLTYAHAGGNTLVIVDARSLNVVAKVELPSR